MGDIYPDAGEADHDGTGDQMKAGGAFLQGFKVVRQLRYERAKDIQKMLSMASDPLAII
jgi:hypothetical protein